MSMNIQEITKEDFDALELPTNKTEFVGALTPGVALTDVVQSFISRLAAMELEIDAVTGIWQVSNYWEDRPEAALVMVVELPPEEEQQ